MILFISIDFSYCPRSVSELPNTNITSQAISMYQAFDLVDGFEFEGFLEVIPVFNTFHHNRFHSTCCSNRKSRTAYIGE